MNVFLLYCITHSCQHISAKSHPSPRHPFDKLRNKNMKPRDFTRLAQDKDFKPQRHRASKGQKKYFLTKLTGLKEIKSRYMKHGNAGM